LSGAIRPCEALRPRSHRGDQRTGRTPAGSADQPNSREPLDRGLEWGA